jgi:hypothetical protein
MSAGSVEAGPLAGHAEAFAEIAESAKLGPYGRDYRSPDEESAAERMSDRDPDRPPVTPMTDKNSPMLTRIRARSSPDYFSQE